MLWYQGSIAEAVNLSKQRNAIFVVFVEATTLSHNLCTSFAEFKQAIAYNRPTDEVHRYCDRVVEADVSLSYWTPVHKGTEALVNHFAELKSLKYCEDELSSQLAQVISSAAITKKLGNEANFLNIKLQSGSVNYTHFARIYQFVPVPSLFFLGQNGTPLEVVGAGIAEENLSSRIDKILEEHRKTIPSLSPSTTSVAKEQSKSLIDNEATVNEPHLAAAKQSEPVSSADMPSTSSECSYPKAEVRKIEDAETSAGPATKVQKTHHEVTKSGQEYEVVCNDDVCVRVPKKPESPAASASQPPRQELAGSSSSNTSVEERTERARQLVEARRVEKAHEEIEAEKARELERRARGQGVAELRRWQQDQEMKQLQEERRRERLSEELARQRVLAQIAQDRKETRAREVAETASAPAAVNVDTPQGISTPLLSTGQARIVIKLPDGSAHTVTLREDDTLATLRRYVDYNLRLSGTTYTLWTAFPRRELTEDAASLLSLSLAPSAAVFVVTARRAEFEVQDPRQMMAIILKSRLLLLSRVFTSLVLDPPYRLWRWVQGILFPPTTPSEPSTGTTTTATGPSNHSNLESGLRYRPRNNIHSLAGEGPDDDENNTWNGNSTQQM